MKHEVLIAALVAIIAVSGLVLVSTPSPSGAATNPHIGCAGYWTYVYGLEDGGGLQCVNASSSPVGGSYRGGGELGSWPEPQNIRKKQTGGGFTQQEIQQMRERAARGNVREQ